MFFRAASSAGPWSAERNLEDELTLTALRMALSRIQPGLVHHSDRRCQYASAAYTDLLRPSQVDISMSRKGNPWDNAACKSFIKTLKYGGNRRNEYRKWLNSGTSSWKRSTMKNA